MPSTRRCKRFVSDWFCTADMANVGPLRRFMCKTWDDSMKKKATAGLIMLIASTLPACSSDQVKRSAYEAVYQKDCMDRTGVSSCDPTHMTYDEYNEDRERLVKPGP
jgi:hypothetical protein